MSKFNGVQVNGERLDGFHIVTPPVRARQPRPRVGRRRERPLTMKEKLRLIEVYDF